MSVRVPKSKTDQYRKESSILVAHFSTATCPVGIMECYFKKAGLNHTTTKFVLHVRGIMHPKMGKRLDSQATSATLGRRS